MSGGSPWGRHARQWNLVGPPLRPSPEDVAVVRAALDDPGAGPADPTLLVLGVTPELCSLPRSPRSRVVAIDRSWEMVRSVWPGRLRPRDEALCADWRRLPLRSGSVDLALSDGALTNLVYPGDYAIVGGELRRVLRSEGRWVARCFVQADHPEAPTAVLADLADGRAGGFHAFKWRLAMALQPDASIGVPLADVWEAFHAAAGDLQALSARCGWSIDVVRTIDAYRGLESRYSFPSLADLRELLARAGFSVLEVSIPSYELGDRCPTLVLAPTGAAARIA